MTEELKPCPFCGGEPEITTRDVEPQGDDWYGGKTETFVLCGCGACLFDGHFHEGFYDPETRAVEAWNRRTLLAAGASEGQAVYQARKVGQLKWQDIAEISVAMFAMRDEDYETRVLYLHPSAEIAVLRERIAGMEKDAGMTYEQIAEKLSNDGYSKQADVIRQIVAKEPQG